VSGAKNIDFQMLSKEDMDSKEQKKENPLGQYPCLKTPQGTLAGVLPICKYIAKRSQKLLGSG